MKFGDNLKSIRKMKKVSQEDLADKLGVSRQSVSKWETGENYPTMQNIVCLCSIFKCKMNDLVHEDFDDLDFLDEEIKMSVVKLNEKEQKNIKVISNILFMIARIGAIISRVAMGFVVAAMIFVPILINSIEINDNRIISNGKVFTVTEIHDGVRISSSQNEHIIISDINNKDVELIKNAITKQSKTKLIIFIELGFAFIVAFLVFISMALSKMDKLFVNIHDGETPFTLDNISYLKKMAYYFIIAIVLSAIGSTMFNIGIGVDNVVEFNLFNITEIIFLFAMSLVFEYGYRIQQDSKGKMYGKED
ncbi:MAG: helix-turn-helix transcriptional regulator [Bacilli bacterium]|nr:helix-turn-helix transcriptional regulator [Bacilli bacterium]